MMDVRAGLRAASVRSPLQIRVTYVTETRVGYIIEKGLGNEPPHFTTADRAQFARAMASGNWIDVTVCE